MVLGGERERTMVEERGRRKVREKGTMRELREDQSA